MTLYYIGRLDGRGVKVNVEALIVQEANKMTSVDYVSESKRCEAGLTEKGQQITQIGRDLTEHDKSPSDQVGKSR